MKVLVTGGCGFLGTHTCEYFRKLGWEVIAYDSQTKFELSRTGYDAEKAREHNSNFLSNIGVETICGDVRNLEQLLDCSSGCNYIIHTAAQPAVTISMEEPLMDLFTNVAGTVNVLEAARRRDIPAVSCATIHVYGNWINDELKEAETRFLYPPLTVDEGAKTMEGYLTPLHASKASAEIYVRVYAQTYGVRVASFRLTGLYGTRQFGGEDHGWVANFTIRNILGWPLTIFGTGKQVRDILYASDVARAFHCFYEQGEAGIYNIGGGPLHAISLIECIELIGRYTGSHSSVQYGPERFGDLKYFVCDTHKARQKLGWEPFIRPQEGVSLLVDWVKANRMIFDGSLE